MSSGPLEFPVKEEMYYKESQANNSEDDISTVDIFALMAEDFKDKDCTINIESYDNSLMSASEMINQLMTDPPNVSSSTNEEVPSPKKRKKYEQPPFENEDEERKRLNAKKARQNRLRKKEKEEEYLAELDQIKEENDNLKLRLIQEEAKLAQKEAVWEAKEKYFEELKQAWSKKEEQSSKTIDFYQEIIRKAGITLIKVSWEQEIPENLLTSLRRNLPLQQFVYKGK